MTLIPKISRLKKLPELLRRKKDAEKRSEENKEDAQDKRPPFEIEDEVSINPEAISDLKIHQPPSPNRKALSADDENVGKNVDLTV